MNYKQITTIAAAFAALNMDINNVPDVSAWPESMRQHKISEWKLSVVVEALNEGWVPDWNNISERKYYPWWLVQNDDNRASGRGLSFYVCGCAYGNAHVAPRLVLKDKDRVYHLRDFFKELYEEYYLG